MMYRNIGLSFRETLPLSVHCAGIALVWVASIPSWPYLYQYVFNSQEYQLNYEVPNNQIRKTSYFAFSRTFHGNS